MENIKEEIWRQTEEYPTLFISNKGNCFTMKNNKKYPIIVHKTYLKFTIDNKRMHLNLLTILSKYFTREEINCDLFKITDDLEGEIWKDITGFGNKYQISNLARVKSIQPYGNSVDRILKQNICKKYMHTHLSINNKCTHVLVHRLMALAFVPNPNNFEEVNHINGDRLDNRLSNLEWVTPREKTCHASMRKKNKDSKYVGVYRNPGCSTWFAKICINGKQLRFYGFKTSVSAYKKYLKVAKENGIINRYALPLNSKVNLWSIAFNSNLNV